MRSPKEQEVINLVAKQEGEEWAEKHANLIVAQAHLIGAI